MARRCKYGRRKNSKRCRKTPRTGRRSRRSSSRRSRSRRGVKCRHGYLKHPRGRRICKRK